MNFLDYAFYHVACVVRLLKGDAAALNDMDISADGFWRSFEAIPAAAPALIFSWVIQARWLQATGLDASLGSILLRGAILELVFWIAPIIVLAFVLKTLRMTHRFTHLIVARNWLSVVTNYLFLVIPLADLVTGNDASRNLSAWLTLFAIGIGFWFSMRVTRIALNVPVMVAIAFVGIETVITYPLFFAAYGAAGFYPAV